MQVPTGRARRQVVTLLLLGFAVAGIASAQVPEQISYQGVLVDTAGKPVPPGLYSLKFSIHELPSGGGAPLASQTLDVQVKDGLYNVILTDAPLVQALDAGGSPRYMQVEIVSGFPGAPLILEPRQQISSVPYALHAGGGGGGFVPGIYDTTIEGSTSQSCTDWKTDVGIAAGNILSTTVDFSNRPGSSHGLVFAGVTLTETSLGSAGFDVRLEDNTDISDQDSHTIEVNDAGGVGGHDSAMMVFHVTLGAGTHTIALKAVECQGSAPTIRGTHLVFVDLGPAP